MTEGGEGSKVDVRYEARHKKIEALGKLEAEAAKVKMDRLAGSQRPRQRGTVKSVLRRVLGR